MLFTYHDKKDSIIDIPLIDGIPEYLPVECCVFIPEKILYLYDTKDTYIKEKGMYAFVSWRWVIPFAQWIGNRKVLEVMCGVGWLAKALRIKGIDVIATDTRHWEREAKWKAQTDIEEISAIRAVRKYGKDCPILIVSWPYMDDNAAMIVRAYHLINPVGIVVYIGEKSGGCTASDKFFDHFERIKDPSFAATAEAFQSWYAVNDKIWIGKYKETTKTNEL